MGALKDRATRSEVDVLKELRWAISPKITES